MPTRSCYLPKFHGDIWQEVFWFLPPMWIVQFANVISQDCHLQSLLRIILNTPVSFHFPRDIDIGHEREFYWELDKFNRVTIVFQEHGVQDKIQNVFRTLQLEIPSLKYYSIAEIRVDLSRDNLKFNRFPNLKRVVISLASPEKSLPHYVVISLPLTVKLLAIHGTRHNRICWVGQMNVFQLEIHGLRYFCKHATKGLNKSSFPRLRRLTVCDCDKKWLAYMVNTFPTIANICTSIS